MTTISELALAYRPQCFEWSAPGPRCTNPANHLIEPGGWGDGYLPICHRHRHYYNTGAVPVSGIPLAYTATWDEDAPATAKVIGEAVMKAKHEYDRLRTDKVPFDECWAEIEALACLLDPS
jgi:hypothetical protein